MEKMIVTIEKVEERRFVFILDAHDELKQNVFPINSRIFEEDEMGSFTVYVTGMNGTVMHKYEEDYVIDFALYKDYKEMFNDHIYLNISKYCNNKLINLYRHFQNGNNK